MSAATGDPVADYLLDWIAVPESRGNYDAYFGKATAPEGTITAKTIFEVYAFQTTMVSGGAASSAVGRYQFIKKTLQGLVASGGIDGTARLDAALQDSLALRLLQGRGYRAWLAGRLSDDEFLYRLSCEWASLPDPKNAGKSHYDGVGPNRAHYTLAQAKEALTAAKTLV